MIRYKEMNLFLIILLNYLISCKQIIDETLINADKIFLKRNYLQALQFYKRVSFLKDKVFKQIK